MKTPLWAKRLCKALIVKEEEGKTCKAGVVKRQKMARLKKAAGSSHQGRASIHEEGRAGGTMHWAWEAAWHSGVLNTAH